MSFYFVSGFFSAPVSAIILYDLLSLYIDAASVRVMISLLE